MDIVGSPHASAAGASTSESMWRSVAVFVKELHCRICFYRPKIEACRENYVHYLGNPFVINFDFAHDRNDPGTKPMRGEEAHAKVFLETVETQERNGALPYDVVKGYAFRLASLRHRLPTPWESWVSTRNRGADGYH